MLELVNVPEFEAMARLVLPRERFEAVRGGRRTSFDRMTFRQRLMVYAMDLDLTTRLFGHDMFAPIIVGPVARQGELHPDGELATARGASAAKAVMVATRQSSRPIDEVVAASDEPVWYQLYADAGELEETPRGPSTPAAAPSASPSACPPTIAPPRPTGTLSVAWQRRSTFPSWSRES